jgi:hypothetical protein
LIDWTEYASHDSRIWFVVQEAQQLWQPCTQQNNSPLPDESFFDTDEAGEVSFPLKGGREFFSFKGQPIMRFDHVQIGKTRLSSFGRVTLDDSVDAVFLFFVPLPSGQAFAVVVSNPSHSWLELHHGTQLKATILQLPSKRFELRTPSEEASAALRERIDEVHLEPVADMFKKACAKLKQEKRQHKADAHVFPDLWCDVCGRTDIKDVMFQCSRCPEGDFDLCAKCAIKTTCSRVSGEEHAITK